MVYCIFMICDLWYMISDILIYIYLQYDIGYIHVCIYIWMVYTCI
jgi:hypothetical protein